MWNTGVVWRLRDFMEKKHDFQMGVFIPAGIAIIWIIAFLIYQDSPDAGDSYWIAFVFGLIGLVATEISMVLRSKSNSSTLEIGAISIVYTVIFAITNLILNVIFSLSKKNELALVFVIINLAVLLVYAVLIYYSNKYVLRVNGLTDYSADKMVSVSEISKQLAILINMSSDNEVVTELKKLKENIDYSNNVSQNFSRDQEKIFLQKIHSLQNDIADGAEKDIVVSKIRDASVTWGLRNSRVNNIK